MAKKLTISNGTMAKMQAMRNELVANVMLMRDQFIDKLFDTKRDVDKECGYPETITPAAYKLLYDRMGVAARVVDVYPDECFAMGFALEEKEKNTGDAASSMKTNAFPPKPAAPPAPGQPPQQGNPPPPPVIMPTKKGVTVPKQTKKKDTKTEFEKAWEALGKKHNMSSFMQTADRVCGIGRYGVVFFGLKDGKEPGDPAPGVDEKTGELNLEDVGEVDPSQLVYLRVFDESSLQIQSRETDPTSPRFGKPTFYNIVFVDPTEGANIGDASTTINRTLRVHWTRCIHIAEGCTTSMIFGRPRMERCFNTLMDLKKVGGGSAEMFWKGAFPGLSIEANPSGTPGIGMVMDVESIKGQVQAYSNGLQRYLALNGASAKSLSSQIGDPGPHVERAVNDLCITLGIPTRVFVGSERGELASSQDAKAWHSRVKQRQDNHLTPNVVRAIVDRLQSLAILPVVEYEVEWPDKNTATEAEIADVALKETQALVAYVGGGVETVVPPAEYLIHFMGKDPDLVDEILSAAVDHQDLLDEEDAAQQEDAAAALDKAHAENPPPPQAQGEPPQVGGKPGKASQTPPGKAPPPPFGGK